MFKTQNTDILTVASFNQWTAFKTDEKLSLVSSGFY